MVQRVLTVLVPKVLVVLKVPCLRVPRPALLAPIALLALAPLAPPAPLAPLAPLALAPLARPAPLAPLAPLTLAPSAPLAPAPSALLSEIRAIKAVDNHAHV